MTATEIKLAQTLRIIHILCACKEEYEENNIHKATRRPETGSGHPKDSKRISGEKN